MIPIHAATVAGEVLENLGMTDGVAIGLLGFGSCKIEELGPAILLWPSQEFLILWGGASLAACQDWCENEAQSELATG